MKEAAIYAALKASLDSGAISPAARQFIVGGSHAKFASTRALTDQILSRLFSRPGPASQLDDRARALNRKRDLRNLGLDADTITLKLADEFPMLDNFAEVMARKPSGPLIRRARELKFDESLVGLESESFEP
jgi:hypothetical protein